MPNLSPLFTFDNTFASEMKDLYAHAQAAQVANPKLVKFNHDLAHMLGLSEQVLDAPLSTAIFSGNQVPEGAMPIAQAYAGHQFGGYSAQLGDGRALLLGEIIDTQGQRRDIALKGSGKTQFSRGGDGKATLGPILREYLMGEAMTALGIPSTRALAVVSTGELVYRQNGALSGAILTRVAASHIRIGTFQYAATHQDTDLLRRLANYVINRHFPELSHTSNPYLGLLQAAAARQAQLVAQWMHVGFIHGVMNTDNITLSGETLDYGPCAFMEHYDDKTVFSSIDRTGRYAYGNQPMIARWNLARLAEALLPLLHESVDQALALAISVVDDFPARYDYYWLAGMRYKLGLASERPEDMVLAQNFIATMRNQNVDMTLAYRRLADIAASDTLNTVSHLQALYTDSSALMVWLSEWRERLLIEPITAQRAASMNAVNPLYIPRNSLVEKALDDAIEGDLQPFNTLLNVLQHPYIEQPEWADYAKPSGLAFSMHYQTFCGT